MLRFRTAALVAALMIGSTAVAGAQRGPEEGGRQSRMKAAQGRMHQALFRDITLTDAQKTRLEAIRTAYRPQFQALREQARPQMQSMREARQQNDTVAMRTARTQLEQHRTQVTALMEKQRAEVRAVLTTEQQATFDRNVTQMRERAMQRAENKRKGGGHKGRRGGPHRGA